MNLHISKSKNSESFYIAKSYVKANGSTTSLVGPCSTISWSKVPSLRTIMDVVLPLALT